MSMHVCAHTHTYGFFRVGDADAQWNEYYQALKYQWAGVSIELPKAI